MVQLIRRNINTFIINLSDNPKSKKKNLVCFVSLNTMSAQTSIQPDYISKLQAIVDKISNKKPFTIRVFQSFCNANGEILVNLNPAFKPADDRTYTVSLISFSTTSLFPNITDKNNKFYYSLPTSDVIHVITITPGNYLLYNSKDPASELTYAGKIAAGMARNRHDSSSISITLDEATGLTSIKLRNGYKVYFNKENTWGESLGFANRVLASDGDYIGNKLTDLWPTRRIYISCSICRGNRSIKADGTSQVDDIIYDFPNNFKYGSPITLLLDAKLTETELNLSTGQISRISMKFFDDYGVPVTFQGAPVSFSLRIRAA